MEMQKKNNPRVRADLVPPFTDGVGASHISSHRILANNLMNALPTQVKLVRDLAQRLTAAVEFHNLDIPVRVSGRPRTQRTPLPSAERFKNSDARGSKLPFATALPKVTNPRTKRDFQVADKLSVNSRNAEVPFPFAETIECFKGQFKPRDVVHVKDNSKDAAEVRLTPLRF